MITLFSIAQHIYKYFIKKNDNSTVNTSSRIKCSLSVAIQKFIQQTRYFKRLTRYLKFHQKRIIFVNN